MRRAIPLFAFLILACPLLAGAATNNTDTNAGEVTWAEHVAPILFSNCASCHRPDQAAPMSFLTYKETRPWARAIRRSTAQGTMPPWFANPEHGDFVEDPTLTEEELDVIARWVKAGAPSGDLETAPAPPTFDSEWEAGQPDVILTMEPFEISDDVEDYYHWVQVDNPSNEERWIASMEVKPGFATAVHHNLTYLGPSDATVQSIRGAGQIDLTFVGGWGPGVRPLVHPDGYGLRMAPNSTVFFQMHYHKTPGPGTGGTDQTRVGLRFYEEKPENAMTTMWIMDPVLDIPAGEANYTSASSFTTEHDALVFDYTPHMHLRGKAMRFTAELPNGEKEILLDVVDYDFNWQLTYTPKEPTFLPAGTRIAVDAVFDNSAENPLNPDPTINVKFGEKTTDEMMVGFLHYTYVDQEQQADMPTMSVPENLREQFDRLREFRDQQKKAKAAAESGAGGR